MGKNKAPDYGPLAEANRYAADLQYEASQNAIRIWQEHQEQVRVDYQPWRDVGQYALGQLDDGIRSGAFDMEDWEPPDAETFKQDPGYQFRLQEGEKAIQRAAAAGSGSQSGSTLKALQAYGQGMASQEYGNAYNRALTNFGVRQGQLDKKYNRWAGLSGTGMLATDRVTATGSQVANQTSQYGMSGATALGGGAIGSANAGIMQQEAANAASQANFNNLLAVGKLAAGAY